MDSNNGPVKSDEVKSNQRARLPVKHDDDSGFPHDREWSEDNLKTWAQENGIPASFKIDP
jgi:hypothetical protein